jgi:hypothetical protein
MISTMRLLLPRVVIVVLLLGMPAWFVNWRGPAMLEARWTLFAPWMIFGVVLPLVACWMARRERCGLAAIDAARPSASDKATEQWTGTLRRQSDEATEPWRQTFHGRSSERKETKTEANGPSVVRRTSARWILLGAIWLHCCGVLMLWPGLSDDVLRYRVDAKAVLAGRSPYAWPATTLPTIGVRLDATDRLMPHAQMSTIYLPVSQAFFAGVRAVETVVETSATQPASTQPLEQTALNRLRQRPGQLTVWRVAMALTAIGTTLAILRCLTSLGRSPWWAIVFAWHPLTIVETAGMAHQDALGAMLVVSAIALLLSRRPAWAGVVMALAVGVKPIGLLVAGVIAMQQLRRSQYSFAICGSIAALLVMSPALAWSANRAGFGQTFVTYAQSWEANSFLLEAWLNQDRGRWLPLEQASKAFYRTASMLILIGWAMTLRIRRGENDLVLAPALSLLTVATLLSPVVYAWYLLWPLALVPLVNWRTSLPTIAWCATAVVSYQMWHEPSWWLPWKWLWVEYAPVGVAVAVCWLLTARSEQRA